MLGLPAVQAQDQTVTFSPVVVNGSLPFDISVSTDSMVSGNLLPTLQSYAFGQVGDDYVFIDGRTNGLHNFTNDGAQNFPPADQNTDIWVINPVTQQVWSSSISNLTNSGLTQAQADSLSVTSPEFHQVGTTLYVAGGYQSSTTSNITTFSTSSNLTAIDLPAVISWVQNGTGSLATDIRQTTSSAVQVTGGALNVMNGTAILTFGQNFDGGYNGTSGTASISQTYTQQAITFTINDDGTNLSITNSSYNATLTATTDPSGNTTNLNSYHRRDLNVVPTLTPDGSGNLVPGQVALAGVFTAGTGVWTVPVEVSANGTLSEKDPAAPGAFLQAMNDYQSPVLSLYDTATNISHNIIFGGISVNAYNATTGNLDYNGTAPWLGQTTDVARDAAGNFTQYLLANGGFPTVAYNGTIDTNLFGAGAQFLLADGLPMLDNGMINLQALTGNTLVGYIFGGIIATNDPNDDTAASNYLFDVYYTPTVVPEPSSFAGVFGVAAGLLALIRRRRLQGSSKLV